MWKTIALVVLIFIATVLIYAATQPDDFRVERTITIQSPPEKIFPLINDFHQWEAWSPWEKVDPNVKRTYSGAAMGKGAVYKWNGNKEIGQGRMEIAESIPLSKIIINIHFLKPFEARNTIDISLYPEGKATRVTQAMYGPSPFISKVICLFFSMDKMVGSKFEEGLGNLKGLAEKQ